MVDVDRLESIAQQLVARVRDDDPEANLRWLRAELGTDPNSPVTDTERLLFVLAAAVPDDKRWWDLIAWCEPLRTPVDVGKRARMRRVA